MGGDYDCNAGGFCRVCNPLPEVDEAYKLFCEHVLGHIDGDEGIIFCSVCDVAIAPLDEVNVS